MGQSSRFLDHHCPEHSQNIIHLRNCVVGASSDSLKFMTAWGLRSLSGARERLRQRRDLLLEFIVLHHQLAVLQRTGTRRPCFRTSERLFWVFLSRWCANWQRNLIIIQPATVLRWRRRGLWAIWVSGSRRRWRGGRPRISSEVRALVARMSLENFLWGAPRIHGELLKLGFDVSQATVSRYMLRRTYSPSQSWRSFLRNQALGFGTIGPGEAGRISDQVLSSAGGSSGLSRAPPRFGMASLAGRLSHRGLPVALMGAPFVVVADRSVRGASLLQAATVGLLPADGFLRIAPGHHPV